MKLRGLIFDFDGTLADTLVFCIEAFQQVFLHFQGRDYSSDEIQALFGPTEEGVVVQNLEASQHEEGREMFFELYRKHHHLCSQPFDGIREILDWAQSQSIPMALVTGKGPRSTKYSLEFLKLDHYFPIVKTGSDTHNIKTENIEAIVGQWQLPPEQVAYVGDAPSDITCSREAKVLPLSVGWASTTNSEKLKALDPHAFFETPSEFQGWLHAHCAYM